MVQKRDVIPYLVAAKSFCLYANPYRVVVICDPSIDAEDRAIFNKHIPHIELRDAIEFTDPRIPRGGTWERLRAISLYVSESYVVQLDSDTVTIKSIDEVVASVLNGTAFVLAGEPGAELQTLEAASEIASAFKFEKMHIQDLAELKMIELDCPDEQKYIRGCSGFTGFPKSVNMEQKLLNFSEQMSKFIGCRWSEWGTEQVASNYLIANAHGVKVLPATKYGTPDHATETMVFFHFIGYLRYMNNKYQMISRKAIKAAQLASS